MTAVLDQKTFQELVFKAVKNRKRCARGLLIASRSDRFVLGIIRQNSLRLRRIIVNYYDCSILLV